MLKYNIDLVEGSKIAGWVCDVSDPQRCLTVEAVSHSGQSARAPANEFRQDLLETGLGDGAHAFNLDLSGWHSESGDVTVRVFETQDVLGIVQIVLSDPAGPVINEEPSRWRWHIDRVDSLTVIGWVQDTHRPYTTVLLRATGDNGKTVPVIANQYRADLKEAEVGNGHHGFEVNLALIGAMKSIKLYVAETGEALTADPISIDPIEIIKRGGISDKMKTQIQFKISEIRALLNNIESRDGKIDVP